MATADKPVVLLLDGDMFAFRAAAATDGKMYQVKKAIVDEFGDLLITVNTFRYKKEADKHVAENPGSIVEIVYRPEPKQNALFIVDSMIKKAITACEKFFEMSGVRQSTYITEGGSFRNYVDPLYKKNRDHLRRPEHLTACKEYLKSKYTAECEPDVLEADDLLCINAERLKAKFTTVIVTVDKDLNQYPGWHYDPIKETFYEVTEIEALRNLYAQMMIGDSTDNIKGVPGIGPKKAAKLMAPCTTEAQMYQVVLKEWLKAVPVDYTGDQMDFYAKVLEDLRNTARLLYLLRDPDVHWDAPALEVA